VLVVVTLRVVAWPRGREKEMPGLDLREIETERERERGDW
jgi:hypothetical protein